MNATRILLALPLALAFTAAGHAQSTTTTVQTTHDAPMPAPGLLSTTHTQEVVAPDGTKSVSNSTTYTHPDGTTTTDSKTVTQTPPPPPPSTVVIVR